ncbi:MAG TPA: hypothetical protein VG993_04735 [Actinomycetota bacterium]|jgi:hypothetical protein|nr:hypothetical protein [Actinomycetota bacterium]
MTAQRSFKRLVRTRMEKTGESYTAARLVLLRGGADATVPGDDPAPLPTSDDSIRERTGRGWEEWFDVLDAWGAAEKPRREIARWVASQLSTEPLGWNAQAITGSYERARLGREVGQFDDGFRVSVSKTVAVPVERLYDAFVLTRQRKRWLPDVALRRRTATKPLRARFDWGDDGSRLHVTFEGKGEAKSTVTVSHERLDDAEERDRMKSYWKGRMAALKQELER